MSVLPPKESDTFQLIVKEIHECAGDTTLHAIPHLVKRKHRFLKTFWFVSFVVSLSLCIWFLIRIIHDYNNYDVITNIRTNYVNSLNWPVFMFCNLNGSNPNIANIVTSCINYNDQQNCIGDFYFFRDPNWGDCYRYNSKKNASGNRIPLKFTNQAGFQGGIHLELSTGIKSSSLDSAVLMYKSNEIVSSIQDAAIWLSAGQTYFIGLSKTVTTQYPKPFSNCTADLTKATSYSSPVYQKTFKSHPENS
jgi:hypothetical protein